MRPFEFVEPATLAEVVRLLHAGAGQAHLIAGGSDLLGELKDNVVHYRRLVSLAGLAELRAIQQDEAGLRLGALVTLDELEHAGHLRIGDDHARRRRDLGGSGGARSLGALPESFEAATVAGRARDAHTSRSKVIGGVSFGGVRV